MTKQIALIAGAGLLLVVGCASPAPGQPTASPTAPAATSIGAATTAPPSIPTPTPMDTTGPAPTDTPLGLLHMSNRSGGDITFTGTNGCTAVVPITWYPLNSSEVVAGTATIEIDGPGDVAGLTTVNAEGDEVHLVVEFPLGKQPRSWDVTLLQVGDRLVAPAPLDADPPGSRYSFTGPGGNCTP